MRVKPGAKSDAVGGVWHGPAGDALIVAVRAPAVDGKANEALRRVLAEALGVRARDVTVVSGHRGRDKRVEVDASTAAVAERLEALRTA